MGQSSRHPAISIASWITLSRLLLLPLVILPIIADWPNGWFISAVVTALAGLTDMLDGYFARHLKQTSAAGANLDLLIDKIFVLTVLSTMAFYNAIAVWMVIIITFRELIISLVRWLGNPKRRLVSDAWGKAKTALTIFAILCVMLNKDMLTGGITANFANYTPISTLLLRTSWLMVAVVVVTIVSGVHYIVNWAWINKKPCIKNVR